MEYSLPLTQISQICKKAVFIKLVRGLKGYNYTRIHFRQIKVHDASNRYGFKNLTIDTEKLNQYCTNGDKSYITQSDLRNELEAITEHYKNLFETAIPELNGPIITPSSPG